MKLNKSHFKKIVNKFKNKKILVIGDLMIDEYVWGKVSRISPEAPIPVVDVEKEEFKPGGAANVILNLTSLGAKVYSAGVVGDDAGAHKLLNYLKKNKVNIASIIIDKKRPTTIKTRVIAHSQQVVRIDKEKRIPVSTEIINKVINRIEKIIKEVDAVIFSDYGKGVITEKLVDFVVQNANTKIINVDPKPKNIRIFKNVTLISPNKKEAQDATGIHIENEKDIDRAAEELKKITNSKVILLTRGEEGMTLFYENEKHHIPAVAREVYDVTGAGDTVISVMTLALTTGASFKDSAYLANIAAGKVVAEIGVAVLTPEELKGAVDEM
ncbi:MAG: D-glycero-beta-D-manno-heptose-7-phosphate kinase [Candidatus Goldbacteria bacterium]|nr:D-glycero-beta-D-manno-heptose-7-phosphate kinase [Candidatus Goldiibacteriota bacterium]